MELIQLRNMFRFQEGEAFGAYKIPLSIHDLMRFWDVLNYTKSGFHWDLQLQEVSSPLFIALWLSIALSDR